jgi:hypothetical protein
VSYDVYGTGDDLALKPPFECPLCGNEAYDQVEVFDRFGAAKKTQAYQCRGCTVMFKNRDKFTRHRAQSLTVREFRRHTRQK